MFRSKPARPHPPPSLPLLGLERRPSPRVCRLFPLSDGCCPGKENAGGVGMPSVLQCACVAQGAATLQSLTVPASRHHSTRPPTPEPSRVPGPCFCDFASAIALGTALPPQLLAQILSIQDPAQCLLFHSTFSHSATLHSFPPSLCQALGYRDPPDPGSAFESFSEQRSKSTMFHSPAPLREMGSPASCCHAEVPH